MGQKYIYFDNFPNSGLVKKRFAFLVPQTLSPLQNGLFLLFSTYKETFSSIAKFLSFQIKGRISCSGEGEKLISGEEVLGIWSMCVAETEKFFPCGTNGARPFSFPLPLEWDSVGGRISCADPEVGVANAQRPRLRRSAFFVFPSHSNGIRWEAGLAALIRKWALQMLKGRACGARPFSFPPPTRMGFGGRPD
jgi:hypothetical protein